MGRSSQSMPARLDIVQSQAPDRGEGEREAVTNASRSINFCRSCLAAISREGGEIKWRIVKDNAHIQVAVVRLRVMEIIAVHTARQRHTKRCADVVTSNAGL